MNKKRVIITICILIILIFGAVGVYKYVSNKPEGTKIEIEKIVEGGFVGYGGKNEILIRNVEDLENVINESGAPDKNSSLLTTYDASFFEKRDLIFVSFTGNRDLEYEITDVYLNEQTLDIYIDEISMTGTDSLVASPYSYLIEIPKSIPDEQVRINVHFEYVVKKKYLMWMNYLFG